MSEESPYSPETREGVAALVPPRARRILDVGCNDGTFGRLLRSTAGSTREVFGVEPHPLDAERARAVLDGVVTGTYPEALAELDGQFDCVAFNHVLEHLVDPWEALRATLTRLTPDGVVVGEIPNVRFLPFLVRLTLRGDFTYTDSGLLDRTHVRFFTRSGIESLFHEAGYVVDELRPVTAMGNAAVPRLSRVAAGVLRDLAHLAFVFRAHPAPR